MITQNVSQQISQITICNFEDYQRPKASKQASSKPAVSQQQASSKPNYNSKEGKNDNIKEKDIYAEFVKMTKDEHDKLVAKFGKEGTADWIERLNLWKGSKGKQTNSDYMTILSWERREHTNGKVTKSGRELAIERGLHKPKEAK